MRNYDRKNRNMFQVRVYLKELYSFHKKQLSLDYGIDRYIITEKLLEVLQFLSNETTNMKLMKDFKHFIISVYNKVDRTIDTDRDMIVDYHIANLLLNIILTIL